MKIIKRILVFLLIALVLIQFFRPTKNISMAAQPNDIFAHYPASDSVVKIMHTACYDCHSNNTRYPWYNNIQPVAWWLNDHVQGGRHHLNFNEFFSYTQKKQIKKMDEVNDAFVKGWMPISSYTWIHKDAILTKEQTAMMAEWSYALKQKLGATTAN